MNYEFQGLLYKDKDDKITGAMSPVLFAQGMAKHFKFNVNGLVRVDNNQGENSYDHLIVRSKTKHGYNYWFLLDMGINGLIIAAKLFNKNPSLIMTNAYKKEITKENMEHHRANVECFESNDENPIMVLNEKDCLEIFEQAEKSGEFNIKSN